MSNKITADKNLNDSKESVRYLGLWLDTHLEFIDHCKKLCTKCLRTFYTIQRQLKKLWIIKANIAWMILETCILSVIDASSIIWFLTKSPSRKKLTSVYQTVIRTAFHTVKGTPNTHLYKHLYTMNLENRMKILNSKDFNRIIRTPKGTLLAKLMRRTWWPIIRCRGSINPTYITKRSIKKHFKDKPEVTIRNVEFLHNTIIWNMMINAWSEKNDDFKYIKTNTPFSNIRGRLSSYIDLSRPWTDVTLDPTPFIDCPRAIRNKDETTKEILIFTDGSVKGSPGGYGYFIIPRHHYQKWNMTTKAPHTKITRHMAKMQRWIRNNPHSFIKTHSSPLSDRCSIDYCEAQAIQEALNKVITIMRKFEDRKKEYKYSNIRVITDASTVLSYITGEYKIRYSQMKRIIDDIHWSKGILLEEYPYKQVIFQWTKSHHNTFGNEVADFLANEGMKTAWKNKDKNIYDPWTYITLRAVCNRANEIIRKELGREISAKMLDTTYGETYRWTPPYPTTLRKYNRQYRKSMMHFNRDEYRILIAIRTGHDHLQLYRNKLKRCSTILCTCKNGIGKYSHLLLNCRLPHVVRQRTKMIELAKTKLKDWFENIDFKLVGDKEKEKQKKMLNEIDYTKTLLYTDPPSFLPIDDRIQIQKEAIHLYRSCVKYVKLTWKDKREHWHQ